MVIDYFNKLSRDYNYFFYDEYVEMQRISCSELKNVFKIKFDNYIKRNIIKKRFVKIYLDGYYLEGHNKYLVEHKSIECMIYGVDKRRYFVFFLYDQKICEGQIKQSNINKALMNDLLVIMFFSPSFDMKPIDFDSLYESIKDYLEGINTSKKYSNVMGKNEGYFGLNIYNGILESDEIFLRFCSEPEMAYIILEHSLLLKKCILYLIYKRKIKREKSYNKLFEILILKKEKIYYAVKEGNVSDFTLQEIKSNLLACHELEKKLCVQLLNDLLDNKNNSE